MSGAALPLLSGQGLRNWDRVSRAVREASHLGVTFRIAGAGVAITEPPELPRAELVQPSTSGILRSFLNGGDDPDREALAFADKLGVERVLVTTPAETRIAIRQLIRDSKT